MVFLSFLKMFLVMFYLTTSLQELPFQYLLSVSLLHFRSFVWPFLLSHFSFQTLNLFERQTQVSNTLISSFRDIICNSNVILYLSWYGGDRFVNNCSCFHVYRINIMKNISLNALLGPCAVSQQAICTALCHHLCYWHVFALPVVAN